MNKSDTPLLRHITGFLEYCEVEKGLSQLSVKTYARFIEAFKKWTTSNGLKNLRPHELSTAHIWQYRVFLTRYTNPLTKRGLKKSTQNFYIIALRSFLNYLAERGIQSLPADTLKLQKEDTKNRVVKFLNLSQLQALLDAPSIRNTTGLRDRAILEVLFSTGLRVAELAALNCNQLTPKTTDDEYELAVVGKGERPRTVYFSKRALLWIRRYLATRKDNEKALFVSFRSSSNNKRLTTRSIERLVSRYSKMAGLPIITTPHTIRHTFATDLLNQGVDLRIIQEFLGHKNIGTTQIYTHVTNRRLKDIHKSSHSGSRLK
jgi:site-specific recombinase XerD